MAYNEEDYLMLSGIQHFTFCRRQWALIHIENQWSENLRTVEGELMHENAHDPFFSEKRGDTITTRSLNIISCELGLSGMCDVVEFIADDGGISINGRPGNYKVRPVEYKHGEPKKSDADILQLVAQAMCLEEMLCCTVEEGMLYYGGTRRRESVEITEELREKVRQTVAEMHLLFQRGHTPRVKISKSCNACSLKDLCLPKLMKGVDVSSYLKRYLAEEDI